MPWIPKAVFESVQSAQAELIAMFAERIRDKDEQIKQLRIQVAALEAKADMAAQPVATLRARDIMKPVKPATDEGPVGWIEELERVAAQYDKEPEDGIQEH